MNRENIVEAVYDKKRKSKKTNQTKFRIEKTIKRKRINSMLIRKVIVINLVAGLMKIRLSYKMSYFQKPYSHSKRK